MTYKKILLIYKRSIYEKYFVYYKKSFTKGNAKLLKHAKERVLKAHGFHYQTLESVRNILSSHAIEYDELVRGRKVNCSPYDLIITVGGDGTFLEAAKDIKNQTIIGVNSASDYSVGRFCIAKKDDFENVIQKIIARKYKICYLQRLQLKFFRSKIEFHALNDLLICHQNPAAMSRYYLKVGRKIEEQRSSGFWVSTPAGSSGAIKSAGGKILPVTSKKIQYCVRELYEGRNTEYRLKGGIISPRQKIKATSLMHQGAIYADGAHTYFPFKHGTTISISLSPLPIKTIKVE